MGRLPWHIGRIDDPLGASFETEAGLGPVTAASDVADNHSERNGAEAGSRATKKAAPGTLVPGAAEAWSGLVLFPHQRDWFTAQSS